MKTKSRPTQESYRATASPGGQEVETRQSHEHGETEEPLSPHTKLPISHPESQAVERSRYEMQSSLASATPQEVVDAFGNTARSSE